MTCHDARGKPCPQTAIVRLVDVNGSPLGAPLMCGDHAAAVIRDYKAEGVIGCEPVCTHCGRPKRTWPAVQPHLCSPPAWVNCIRAPG